MDTETPIGWLDCPSTRQHATIPLRLRLCHTHLVGAVGTGKSTLMEQMVLHDILAGHGVAVLDPYGDLVERLLRLIPHGHIDRVIYLKPGDPDWIPIWNPLLSQTPADGARIVDSLARLFAPESFGDRPEHILRQTLRVVLQLPGGNLVDGLGLIRRRPGQNVRLLGQILRRLNDPIATRFWQQDFRRYPSHALRQSASVLDSLADSASCSRMLSQRGSAFQFRDVMDSGRVLLLDLSLIGPEARAILGGLILVLLHVAASGRRAEDSTLCPFHIHCDDAHCFRADALWDLVHEARRFGVSLTVAHQRLDRLPGQNDYIPGICGSSIMFRVRGSDAQCLHRDLRSGVGVDKLVTLKLGQAIARIGDEVVCLKMVPPLAMPRDDCRQLIVQQSHERYCRPVR